jgi:hypothetical protein
MEQMPGCIFVPSQSASRVFRVGEKQLLEIGVITARCRWGMLSVRKVFKSLSGMLARAPTALHRHVWCFTLPPRAVAEVTRG